MVRYNLNLKPLIAIGFSIVLIFSLKKLGILQRTDVLTTISRLDYN